MVVHPNQFDVVTGFSISFGVDGLNTKVGGGRSECHRQEPLGGSKFQNLEGQCGVVPFK